MPKATPTASAGSSKPLPIRPTGRPGGGTTTCVVGLQLTHSGRYCFEKPIIAQHDPLLDPRTFADKATGAKIDAELSP